MLYNALKAVIQGGVNREDMLKKLDVFMAIDRITLDEYEELVAMLPKESEVEEEASV